MRCSYHESERKKENTQCLVTLPDVVIKVVCEILNAYTVSSIFENACIWNCMCDSSCCLLQMMMITIIWFIGPRNILIETHTLITHTQVLFHSPRTLAITDDAQCKCFRFFFFENDRHLIYAHTFTTSSSNNFCCFHFVLRQRNMNLKNVDRCLCVRSYVPVRE